MKSSFISDEDGKIKKSSSLDNTVNRWIMLI